MATRNDSCNAGFFTGDVDFTKIDPNPVAAAMALFSFLLMSDILPAVDFRCPIKSAVSCSSPSLFSLPAVTAVLLNFVAFTQWSLRPLFFQIKFKPPKHWMLTASLYLMQTHFQWKVMTQTQDECTLHVFWNKGFAFVI